MAAGAIVLGLAAVLISRYASLGSIAVALSLPVLFAAGAHWAGMPWVHTAYAAAAGTLSLLSLRPNIRRLLTRQERRLGQALSLPVSGPKKQVPVTEHIRPPRAG